MFSRFRLKFGRTPNTRRMFASRTRSVAFNNKKKAVAFLGFAAGTVLLSTMALGQESQPQKVEEQTTSQETSEEGANNDVNNPLVQADYLIVGVSKETLLAVEKIRKEVGDDKVIVVASLYVPDSLREKLLELKVIIVDAFVVFSDKTNLAEIVPQDRSKDVHLMRYSKALVIPTPRPAFIPYEVEDSVINSGGFLAVAREADFDINNLGDARHVTVIGGGKTGSQIAYNIRDKASTTIIAPNGILGEIFPEYLSQYQTNQFQKQGITVVQKKVAKIGKGNSKNYQVNFEDGTFLETDAVVTSTGRRFPLQCRGIELTEDFLPVVNSEFYSQNNIYAGGSVSHFPSVLHKRGIIKGDFEPTIAVEYAVYNILHSDKTVMYRHSIQEYALDFGPDVYSLFGSLNKNSRTSGVWLKGAIPDGSPLPAIGAPMEDVYNFLDMPEFKEQRQQRRLEARLKEKSPRTRLESGNVDGGQTTPEEMKKDLIQRLQTIIPKLEESVQSPEHKNREKELTLQRNHEKKLTESYNSGSNNFERNNVFASGIVYYYSPTEKEREKKIDGLIVKNMPDEIINQAMEAVAEKFYDTDALKSKASFVKYAR